VRIFSLRSPVPTCRLLCSASSSRFFLRASSCSRAFSILSAFSLFWSWDFSSWQDTTIPLGSWVTRTAESVVFTDCPPGPVDLNTSILRSEGLMSTSTSSLSGSTATVAVEVCMRPLDSVAGTLWTRWTPDSYFMRR